MTGNFRPRPYSTAGVAVGPVFAHGGRGSRRRWALRVILMLWIMLCSCESDRREEIGSPVDESGIDAFLVDRVSLAEPEGLPLTSICAVDVSPDGEVIAVTDMGSGVVYLFAARGNLVAAVRPGLELTDSLIANRLPADTCPFRLLPRDSITDAYGNRASLRDQARALQNKFENAVFMSDSELLIAATLTAVVVNDHGQRGILGHTAVLKYDVVRRSIEWVRPLEAYRNQTFPQTDVVRFLPSDQTLVISAMNFEAVRHEGYDSAWTLSLFDLVGRRIKDLLPLPERHRARSIGYNWFRVFVTALDGQRVIATTSSVPTVFDIASGRSFSLAGLPGDNADFFDKAGVSDNSEESMRSLAQRLKLRCWGIYDSGNRQFVVPMTFKQPDSTPAERWLVHKYDMSGALHAKVDFGSESEYGVVKYVSYSARNDMILAFALSKTDGWSLLFMKWARSDAE